MLNRTLRIALAGWILSSAAFAADISGAWQFTLETAKGKGSPSFEFKQEGEKLTGTYSGKFGTAALTGSVKGDQVEFVFEAPKSAGKFHYTGTVSGAASMKGF